jgi:hypothetical protein
MERNRLNKLGRERKEGVRDRISLGHEKEEGIGLKGDRASSGQIEEDSTEVKRYFKKP